MKRALAVTMLIGCYALSGVSPPAARAVLLAYEDFNYGAIGSDLTGNSGGGSFGFSDAWTGQTSYNLGNGSLASPSNLLPIVGNSVTAVAFGENRGIDRTLTSTLGVEDTSLYVSILMRPQGILGQGAYGGWFGLALRGSPDIVVGMSYGGANYGLEVGGEKVLTSRAAVINRTEFFVLRFDFTEGVDPTYLYVNPQPGAPEPLAPSASLINFDVNFLNKVSLTGPGGSGFDSLRIGTTYLDVAPPVADFNKSGAVNGADLTLLRSGFGTPTGATHAQGDANGDGAINGSDFLIWQRQVGTTYPAPPGALAVPEPTTWMLALGAALAAFRRRVSRYRGG